MWAPWWGCSGAPQPIRETLAQWAHVGGQPVPPLGGETGEGGPALGEVLGGPARGPQSGAGAAASVKEGRAHDHAALPGLPHRERELAVVAVEEAVALVEAADLIQQGAAKE